MKRWLPLISMAGLALVIVPAVLYLTGTITKDLMTTLMLAGTVVWFVTAPLWIGRGEDAAAAGADEPG
jgi:hypothetical protein